LFDAENAADAVLIPYRQLQVSLLPNRRAGIERLTFMKSATNRVVWQQPLGFAQMMNVIDYSAVQIPLQNILVSVRNWLVRGEPQVAKFKHLLQSKVRLFHDLQGSRFCQIKAIAQIDYRTDSIGLRDSFLKAWMARHEGRPLQSPLRVILPKVNAVTQPVVVILTRSKERFSSQQLLCHILIAAMIGEHVGPDFHPPYRLVSLPDLVM
jgi:hypothetical protein